MNSHAICGSRKRSLAFVVACGILSVGVVEHDARAAPFDSRVILRRDSPGAFAIPKMTTTREGTLVIVYQSRSGGDWGKRIVPYSIRSEDGGRTWSEPQSMMPVNFPLSNQSLLKPTGLVVDHHSGDVLAFVSRSPLVNKQGATIQERWFYANLQETRRLGRAWFLVRSQDEGRTWSVPRDITNQLIKKAHWQEWSPVHTGIQLQRGTYAGRLIVPVRCYCPEQDPSQHDLQFQTNSIIYSDDGGQTWTPGGRSQPRFGECSVAERDDGSIYLNQRVSPGQPGYRWRALSLDGGRSFGNTRMTNLTDQRCHAGLAVIEQDGQRWMVMSSVPGKERRGLTISVSLDEGETWTPRRVIHHGHAAYSDLVSLPNGQLVCVYETGEATSRRDLAIARMDLDWVLAGQGP